MTISAINNSKIAAPQAIRFAAGASTFKLPTVSAEKRNADAMGVARDLVGASLIMPLLKQSHNDPFKTAMFHGGQAEEAFNEQLDQQMTDRMTKRMDMPVITAIYRKLTAQRPGAAATAGRMDRHG